MADPRDFQPIDREPRFISDRQNELWNLGWKDIHGAIYEVRRARAGDLWTNRQKQKLAANMRAALTYNLMRTHEKTAAGIQLQNALDIKAYPIKGGSVEVAGKLTRLLKYHSMLNLLPWAYAEIYRDVWGDGLGGTENRRVVIEDPFGEQQTVRLNALQHMFDLSFTRPDQDDMEDQMKISYLTPKGIRRIWRDVDPAALDAMIDESRSSHDVAPKHPLDLAFVAHETSHHDLDPQMVAGVFTKGKIRVIEYNWREMRDVLSLYVAETGQFFNVTTMPPNDLAGMKQFYERQGFTTLLIRQQVPICFEAAIMGSSETAWLTKPKVIGHNSFPWVYAIGHKVGAMISGEGLDLIDPSRGFSKSKSTQLELLAKSGNKGIVTYGDDFTPETAAALKDIYQGRGGMVNLRGATKTISTVDFAAVTGDAYRFAAEEYNLIERMASSPPSLRGQGEGSHQSGVHATTMVAQGMLGSEPIRNNFHLALKLTAERTLRQYQWFDGSIPFRMLPILEDDGTPGEAQFNQHMGDVILHNLQIGQYGVSIDLTSYTTTDRRAQLNEFMQLMQASAQSGLPPEIVMQMSDHPDAEKMSVFFKQMREAAAQQQMIAAIRGEKQVAA